MTEAWSALLPYGGGVIDDPPLLGRRGVRRIFGWTRVPDPTTFGRWLRAASAARARIRPVAGGVGNDSVADCTAWGRRPGSSADVAMEPTVKLSS